MISVAHIYSFYLFPILIRLYPYVPSQLSVLHYKIYIY